MLVPAHGEPVEPRRVCLRRSCGGRDPAALFDVGVSLVGAHAPVMPAKAGIQTRGCAVRMRSRRTRRGVGEGLSCRAKPRHLSGVLVPAHGEPVEPRRVCLRRSCGGRNLAALFDVGASLVGAHAPVMPAKAGIQTCGCAAGMRSRRTRWGVGEGLSCRAKPRHLSGVLVPAHGEPVEPRRVCPRRSCGGRNLAALFDVGVSLVGAYAPVMPAKAGILSAAARRACAAGAHGGAWARACHAERNRGISRACWR